MGGVKSLNNEGIAQPPTFIDRSATFRVHSTVRLSESSQATASTEPVSVMGSASARDDGRQGVKYHFIDHVMAVPSVDFLRFATAECYSALKKRSGLAAIALETVEKCASHAYALLGQPAVEQLSGPLQVADDLACKVLQKLENNYPVISKMPDEVIEHARDFGKRKYTDGRDYVQEKMDDLQDLSDLVLDAASRPVETSMCAARGIVRCTRAIFWRQLAVAELACDTYMKAIVQDFRPKNDPRNWALLRLLRVTWKASVCVSCYAIAEQQRAKHVIERTVATATSFLEEPAEPLHQPTTGSEHAIAAFRHVVKLAVQLGRVYVDHMVLLYRTAWTRLSARFTRPVHSTRTCYEASTMEYTNPARDSDADDSEEGSSESDSDSDSDDSP